ncbi:MULTISPECIES: LacI family DNA-binding transcriptional regulator [Clostridium]|uniref:Putative HTH-type transcriptional repressor ExuR n=2 Tax=Clostridium TaxID=1485 RepID=A0A151ARY0_9CLOT|nr:MULTISPECIES: LacI family DNA-binding transcriptional regulator [Clostridium]KYH30408.1 putative HTH-type transcriptional repressor ExuR [Clostridium colicanis DSM 13634]MBE6044375.1 LacI family transcriptional regulator [Clostridium thermopalmarium]PRR76485.1 putative HTH-type transcriptional repressor ExuR [Clostridium thermopalmarium DSM 5974]PVZ28402.1 LacI family transcriptional regulator [Clostridium thermopalmarium DSM 5974]
MSVTIKDIAKLANVSHTTVSRALNDSPFINDETKNKIKAIAKQLNYVPNYNAKSLVLDKSYTIGLFFSTIYKGTSPGFFYETVKGVSSEIEDKYNLVVKGISDYKEFSSINRKRFDGIIVMSQSDKDNMFIYNAIEKEIPIVVLNREVEADSVVNILSGDRKGAYNAVDYLIKNGHKDIAIIEGAKVFKSTYERKEGFLNALIDNDIPVKSEYMVQGEYDMESGYLAMKKLLSLPKIPTAVFCSNDDMAVGAFKAAFEAKLSIPDDISIMGFDNNVFSPYLTPALTTVQRSIEKVSKQGAKKLLEIINSGEKKGERIYIDTELIIRESVKKLND